MALNAFSSRRNSSVFRLRGAAGGRMFLAVLAAALAASAGAHAPLIAAPGDGQAHTVLTDGLRAGADPADTGWLKLFADSTELPRTFYNVGEMCFWGTGSSIADSLLKEANIRGTGVELAWGSVQGKGGNPPYTEYNLWGLEDRINNYVRDGISVVGLIGYTPTWANGILRKSFPPNIPVEQEVLDVSGGEATLAHAPVIKILPLWYPLIVTPYPLETERREDEVITTNFVQDVFFDDYSPRTSMTPVVVGTEQVWVDEGAGWQLWTRVDNIFDAPANAPVYMLNRLGVVRFVPRNLYNHGRPPAAGSKVKISYDRILSSYREGSDFTFNHMTGEVTWRSAQISGNITDEQFEEDTLNPLWSWENAPAAWDVNQTAPGQLHFAVSQPVTTGVGHFLYQTVSGSGDFKVSMSVTRHATWELGVPTPFAHTGIMVYQDANNWFRYGLTSDQGRPYLTRCKDGVVTTQGSDGSIGFQVVAPRWIHVRKTGNQYYLYTSYAKNATGPDGGYQMGVLVDHALIYPLRVGISSVGQDTSGVDVDEFSIQDPGIPLNGQVAAFYNYLWTEPWANYVRDIVGHYKDRIKYWQVWNEPDQWWVWSGGQDIYAIMLREFYTALREADPTAVGIAGGYANGANRLLGDVYSTIGPGYFDQASWHPYLHSNKSPDAAYWFTAPHDAGRNHMIANGDGGKEVFFGEVAVDSGVLQSGGGMNDQKQADYAIRLLMMSRKLGWVSGIQWWPANGDLSPVGTSEDNQYGAHAGLFYQSSGYQRDIASITRSGNQVALVVTNHIDVNYKVGDRVTVSGIAAPHDSFNGDFVLSGIEEIYNPIFGTSRKIKLLYTQNNPVDDSVTAPSGMSLGLVKTTIVPKPAFWAYRNLASNKGFIVDLGQYGTNDVLTPASGKYPLSGVAVGLRERANVGSIEVLTSMTCTDERSRPDHVAARLIGATVTPVVVTVNPESPSLATEKWTLRATTSTTFSVEGSVSGPQGTATTGVPFSSPNGAVVSLTLPPRTYVVGQQWVFNTFAGDGWQQAATWTNDGAAGPGDIQIIFQEPVDARYVAIRFTRAAGAPSIELDEISVLDTGNTNVAEGKLYLVDGYQPCFTAPEQITRLADIKGHPDETRVTLSGADLYLLGGGFGYVESSDRAAGVRLEGVLSGAEGDTVTLTGILKTSPGGERYILVQSMASSGIGGVQPLMTNENGIHSRLADGLLITHWGFVKPGSISSASYEIVDASAEGSIRVVTDGAPEVAEGEFVIVTGAAGYDSGRVIYQR